MPSNIEIKAKIHDLQAKIVLIEALADRGPETLHQTDTFYKVESGRLKLRQFGNGTAELIFYERTDAAGASQSFYKRVHIPEPVETHNILQRILPVRGIVEKERALYFTGQTRIHLDKVKNLGDFLELEVVLCEGQTKDEGIRIAENISAKLDIKETELLDTAYIDMIEKKHQNY